MEIVAHDVSVIVGEAPANCCPGGEERWACTEGRADRESCCGTMDCAGAECWRGADPDWFCSLPATYRKHLV